MTQGLPFRIEQRGAGVGLHTHIHESGVFGEQFPHPPGKETQPAADHSGARGVRQVVLEIGSAPTVGEYGARADAAGGAGGQFADQRAVGLERSPQTFYQGVKELGAGGGGDAARDLQNDLLHALALGDIDEGALDPGLLRRATLHQAAVRQHRDATPVLAPEQDLGVGDLALFRHPAQIGVAFQGVLEEIAQRGLDQFFHRGVAQQVERRGIRHQDAALHVRLDHRYGYGLEQAAESGFRSAQRVFGLLAVRDVAGETKEVLRIAEVHVVGADLHRADAAVLGAIGDFIDQRAALFHLLPAGPPELGRQRRRDLEDAHREEFLARIAEGASRRFVDVDEVARGIQPEHGAGSGIERETGQGEGLLRFAQALPQRPDFNGRIRDGVRVGHANPLPQATRTYCKRKSRGKEGRTEQNPVRNRLLVGEVKRIHWGSSVGSGRVSARE